MKTYREFYLDYIAEQIGLEYKTKDRSTVGLTHVVEYEALLEAKKEIKALQKEIEDLKLQNKSDEAFKDLFND